MSMLKKFIKFYLKGGLNMRKNGWLSLVAFLLLIIIFTFLV